MSWPMESIDLENKAYLVLLAPDLNDYLNNRFNSSVYLLIKFMIENFFDITLKILTVPSTTGEES